MAYKIAKNILKNGDTTFYIKSINRIPGTENKFKETIVEKFSKKNLEEKGFDATEYVTDKINQLRRQAKQQVKELNYLVDLTLDINFNNDSETTEVNLSKNLGSAVYSKLYHQLEIDEFINNRRRNLDCEFNLNVIFQHLLYSRLLWPASKKNTWEHRERFFGDTDYDIQHIYRSLDYLLKWRTPLLTHLDKQIKDKFGRQDTVVFYDVTNYYFELDKEDGLEGLRARGVSKEHRPEPIIQMGLFMDELCLPITYELFRGNTNDCTTLCDAMDNCIIDFKDSRKIIVADKGMLSYYNILKIREARNGYVISQSIRKSDVSTKEFALSSTGWSDTINSDGEVVYRVKERLIPRKANSYGDIDNKKHSGIYNERQIFIWSKKYQERAAYDRALAVEKAKDTEGKKSKNYKDSNYGKNKYLKKNPVKYNKTIATDSFIYEFDEEKLLEDEKYDGYYILCTNVVGVHSEELINKERSEKFAYYDDRDGFLVLNHIVPACEIIDIYGGLWKIEETFKVTKTGMLNLRPIFHSKTDRIRAHFMICFIALLLERILELQMNWKYSAKTIQESLSSFNAVQLINSNIYQVSYSDNIIKQILETIDLDITKRFMSQEAIRKIFGNTKKKNYEL